MTTDDSERERAAAAMQRLQTVLSGLGADVVARVHERCPYRARDERCTFAGGCVNQRRAARADDGVRIVHCGGDQQLRRADP